MDGLPRCSSNGPAVVACESSTVHDLAFIETDTAWALRTLPAVNKIVRKRKKTFIYIPAEQNFFSVRRSIYENGVTVAKIYSLANDNEMVSGLFKGVENDS
jgi:hypothetical protein